MISSKTNGKLLFQVWPFVHYLSPSDSSSYSIRNNYIYVDMTCDIMIHQFLKKERGRILVVWPSFSLNANSQWFTDSSHAQLCLWQTSRFNWRMVYT